MTERLKTILLDMCIYFQYETTPEDDNFLLKAEKKLGRLNIFPRCLSLFAWINPLHHDSDFNPNKLVIYEEFMDKEVFEEVYEEYKFIFKEIPELNELFELREEDVIFNKTLTKETISEIYKYIDENYSYVPRDWRFRRRGGGWK